MPKTEPDVISLGEAIKEALSQVTSTLEENNQNLVHSIDELTGEIRTLNQNLAYSQIRRTS